MRPRRPEAGFTLIELIIVTAIVIIVGGTLGTFFLGGASPAVASAGRDVTAAFDETRRTALAFDAATLVFAPALTGSGYRARVYQRFPGDPAFRPANGPAFESTVTIGETESPLGAPGFAFAIDSRGTITGFADFAAGATAFTARPCPASGTFTLHLSYEHDTRAVTIPCRLPPGSATPPALESPAAPFVPPPYPVQTCPAGVTCALGPVASASPPPPLPTNSPSSAPLPVSPPPVLPPSPAPGPTACQAGFSGVAPACAGEMIEQYSATANEAASHTSTLFADGSICDDYGCNGSSAPRDWIWACPFAARSGSDGNGGSNPPYQQDTPYFGSVYAMIGIADHDAAQNDGSGFVDTNDSYCVGFVLPGT
jgi:prepilin-type N-terminal cleavage/methylation domain-containing protein